MRGNLTVFSDLFEREQIILTSIFFIWFGRDRERNDEGFCGACGGFYRKEGAIWSAREKGKP